MNWRHFPSFWGRRPIVMSVFHLVNAVLCVPQRGRCPWPFTLWGQQHSVLVPSTTLGQLGFVHGCPRLLASFFFPAGVVICLSLAEFAKQGDCRLWVPYENSTWRPVKGLVDGQPQANEPRPPVAPVDGIPATVLSSDPRNCCEPRNCCPSLHSQFDGYHRISFCGRGSAGAQTGRAHRCPRVRLVPSAEPLRGGAHRHLARPHVPPQRAVRGPVQCLGRVCRDGGWSHDVDLGVVRHAGCGIPRAMCRN